MEETLAPQETDNRFFSRINNKNYYMERSKIQAPCKVRLKN